MGKPRLPRVGRMLNADTEYEVVVVGFGIAGACAAIAAAEGGAPGLAVDRALGGGASVLSGGVIYAGGGLGLAALCGQSIAFSDSPVLWWHQ